MSQHIKEVIKRSVLYQRYRPKNYMPISQERFQHMDDVEKTEVRICANYGNKIDQFSRMCKMIYIRIEPEKRFQSWLDTGLVVPAFDTMTDNIPPNYTLILDHSIEELKNINNSDTNPVQITNLKLLSAVEEYIRRIIAVIESIGNESLNKTREYFMRMFTHRAESLEEALQRILFWSSLFWQSRHRLVGLGRLDMILDRFDNNNIEIGVIKDFYSEIHRYYPYKSNRVTIGDTGQIIILGGVEADGHYFCNHLTYKFIEAMEDMKLPDPKLLLRVSEKMPDELLKKAIRCISIGIGCPLLSNDDVVVPALEDFGYVRDDACNYVTSACWEPVAYGKSLEKNNMNDLNYANAVVAMYKNNGFEQCVDFESLKELYKSCLLKEINNIIVSLDGVKWEPDPLMTFFTYGCVQRGKDISEGGSAYSDYGILGVGISNAVDSLLNVREKVFIQKTWNLTELRTAVLANFEGYEEIREDLNKSTFFGKDEDEVVDLVLELTDYVYDKLSNYRNCFGGKLKCGLSSSNYLENGKGTKATLDGRRNGEPLGVHISSKDAIPFTELISFASKMNYMGNRSNGNVVDFFVSPELIRSNFDKFCVFIKQAIKQGFFQMQMNVVESTILIDAKAHPEKYPNLIVRVWGFSAYFSDLPESYQDLLIRRALQSEGVA